MNNNNNNISKKVAGYTHSVASFCVTLSVSKELNSGLLRDKYIYMLFSKLDLNTGLRFQCTDYSATLSLLPGDISLSEM